MQAVDLGSGAGVRLRHEDAPRVEIVNLHDTSLVTYGDDLLLTTPSYGGFSLHNGDSLNCSPDGSLGLAAQRHFVFEHICLTKDSCGVTRLYDNGLNALAPILFRFLRVVLRNTPPPNHEIGVDCVDFEVLHVGTRVTGVVICLDVYEFGGVGK